MSEFHEKLPNYIEKREDKESLKWSWSGSSYEFFPNLNLDWQQLSEIYESSKKPIGDLGSSFSTLSVEGELRGINILPIDIMHGYNRSRYRGILERRFQQGLDGVYKKQSDGESRKNYLNRVEAAIQKVMNKCIIADLAKIPLKDRSLSMTIAHDSLPKHSLDLKTFLEKQLPEILRVTDLVAYIYPMSIYKTTLWKLKCDPEGKEHDVETSDNDPAYYWKKASEWTPEELKEEKLNRQMNPEAYEEEGSHEKRTLEESLALYKDPESIKQISEVAKKLGFEFRLEKSSKTDEKKHKREAMLGIFTRKN